MSLIGIFKNTSDRHLNIESTENCEWKQVVFTGTKSPINYPYPWATQNLSSKDKEYRSVL